MKGFEEGMHSHVLTAAHKGRGLLPRLALWMERARQRRALASLPSWRLSDIGLTEAERERECAKRFWEK